MNQSILIVIICIFIYMFFNIKKEGFETNQRVIIKVTTGEYLGVCDKKLCIVDISKAANFNILKFSDDLISLSHEGYYINCCFGENCDDNIHVSSFNPYAPNSKLQIVKNDSTYKIQFYDGGFLSNKLGSNLVKTLDNKGVLSVEFI